MSPQNPRVLVLSAPVGGGHKVAAQTIATTLGQANPARYSVVVEDIGSTMHIGPWSIGPTIGNAYGWGISALGGYPHRLIYSLADRLPLLFTGSFTAAFGSQLRQRVLAIRPDVVISTFHILSASLAALLHPFGIPVVSVVTSAGRVNRLWISGRVHHFVFCESESARFATRMGIPLSSASTIPSVITPHAPSALSKNSARRGLGLSPGLTVLLAAGSVGYGPRLCDFLVRLRAERVGAQLIIAPGHNKRLRAKLKRYADASTLFVDPQMSLLPFLTAADVIVGKAGWLTLTEASVVGRPTLVLNHIRGQEDENLLIACAAGAARRVNVTEAVTCIQRYADNPARIREEFPALGSGQQPRIGEVSLYEVIDRVVAERRT